MSEMRPTAAEIEAAHAELKTSKQESLLGWLRERARFDSSGIYTAAADEIERLTAFVTKLANPDFSNVSSPLGPLHAAGLCAEAEIVSKLARRVLAGEWQPAAPESRDG